MINDITQLHFFQSVVWKDGSETGMVRDIDVDNNKVYIKWDENHSVWEDPENLIVIKRDNFEGANSRQIGGDHYIKYGDLQPWDMYYPWKLNWFQGEAINKIVRFRDKGGLEDLEKAIHIIQKMMEEEKKYNPKYKAYANE